MKRELEALLFATDSPLTLGRLAKIFPDAEKAAIKAAVAELQAEYDGHEHAFTIIEFGGGYQIATKPEYSPIVEKMLKTRRFTRLSKAGLEVLAIIAYKQPLTRIEIDEIRGVNSSGAVSTLTERNLITVVGRSATVGNPLLYGTTREFLNHLGLRGLGQLPDLPDLEHVMDNTEELKQFASQIGRDVSDEELAEYFKAPADDEEVTDETDLIDESEVTDESGSGELADAGEVEDALDEEDVQDEADILDAEDSLDDEDNLDDEDADPEPLAEKQENAE